MNNEETMICTRCGQELPRSKLELMKTGTSRRVCNHCKWLYYVKPARERAILRELALRHTVAEPVEAQKHRFRPSKP